MAEDKDVAAHMLVLGAGGWARDLDSINEAAATLKGEI